MRKLLKCIGISMEDTVKVIGWGLLFLAIGKLLGLIGIFLLLCVLGFIYVEDKR